MFNNTIIEHSDSDKVTFHFINIESYSDALKELITSELSNIWNGDNEEVEDIQIVKNEINTFLNDKNDRQKYGIVSEFICHLYLRQQDYKQHFLFSNLEDNSMKKGFDGVYMKDDLLWIFESKSTMPSTTESNHNINISNAYNDVKKKIEGKNTTNNPWKNAYNHAYNRAVKYDKGLVKNLKEFSKDYVDKKYHNISNFNIIPSSTIYLEENWCNIDVDDLSLNLENLTSGYNSNRLNLLCINKKTIDEFLNIIRSE